MREDDDGGEEKSRAVGVASNADVDRSPSTTTRHVIDGADADRNAHSFAVHKGWDPRLDARMIMTDFKASTTSARGSAFGVDGQRKREGGGLI